MNETQAIVDACTRTGDAKMALATVVDVEGSGYRRPGARMLIVEDGRTAGAISGGCLERDVCEHALRAMAARAPLLVTYDTASDADIVWGLGLGCNGMVRVLIEPLQGNAAAHLDFLMRLTHERRAGAAALIFAVDGKEDVRVGDRWFLDQEGTEERTTHGIAVGIVDDAKAVLRSQRSCVRRYQSPAGNVDALIEFVQPPPSLLIFGAGYDALPVMRFARVLGWGVTIVDNQCSSQTAERFRDADQVVLRRAEEAFAHLAIDRQTEAIVMAHNYLHDKEALRALISSPARYIGCLGPRKRSERMLRELREEGSIFNPQQLARVHAPIGLDIGAETPEEIALSILAEIRAALAGREGASLKYKCAPIHEPAAKLESIEQRGQSITEV